MEASPTARARSLPRGANFQGRADANRSLEWAHTRLVTRRVCWKGFQEPQPSGTSLLSQWQ